MIELGTAIGVACQAMVIGMGIGIPIGAALLLMVRNKIVETNRKRKHLREIRAARNRGFDFGEQMRNDDHLNQMYREMSK